MITAYDLVQSIKQYAQHLEENPIFARGMGVSVLNTYIKYADTYFINEFFDKDRNFKPKESLNEYELDLFQHHMAFIEKNGRYYFKGYDLLKEDIK